jgi:hypothetical protein
MLGSAGVHETTSGVTSTSSGETEPINWGH